MKKNPGATRGAGTGGGREKWDLEFVWGKKKVGGVGVRGRLR